MWANLCGMVPTLIKSSHPCLWKMALISVFSKQMLVGKFLPCHFIKQSKQTCLVWYHTSLRFCTCAFTRTFAHNPLADATGCAHVCQTSCDISSSSFCLSLYLKSWFRQIKWSMNYHTHWWVQDWFIRMEFLTLNPLYCLSIK